MHIAVATRRDLPAMTALMIASPLLRRYGVTSRSARSGLGSGLRAGNVLLVAREHGDVVGFAWMILTRAFDQSAYLRLLLVAEGRQSRGAGAKLLARAERTARASGCRHLALLVTTTNRRARSFYARHGYRHVGNLPSFVRPGISESLYLKSWRNSRLSARGARMPRRAG